ncbi:hypothetical protein VTN77DRAFT_9786 [Rasamsonia byssochlamydoides]|uniref:uncharacterized protein n=1 Tax=Rasamsonia byssochlamydoides TaxID=89139 RepID=UPI0037421E9B
MLSKRKNKKKEGLLRVVHFVLSRVVRLVDEGVDARLNPTRDIHLGSVALQSFFELIQVQVYSALRFQSLLNEDVDVGQLHVVTLVEDEVAIMKYLAQNTSIPVPKVLGSGKCAVGPYIVMTIIEGNLLSGYLRNPLKETITLNPKIPESVLKRAYYGMAEIMLELSKPEFPYIGALGQDELGAWTVTKRPLTFNMNRLAQFSNIPPGIFAKQRFTNAADYFEELAKQHLYHLEFQRNDAVADEADCRKKYVALDWEFTYAAPAEFTYTAPWWLLLEHYAFFLMALRECETRKINEGSLSDSQRLSEAMENGLFWLCLAARHSSMFDEIYWTFIDPKYYGPFTTIEDRLGLLGEEERTNLDDFVQSRMKQAREANLAAHQSIDEMVDL